MKPVDLPRLQATLAKLPADDAAWLAAALELPWQARARALSERDASIREGLALLSDLSRCPAARHLEQELQRYLATTWRMDQRAGLLPDASPLRRAVYRIACSSDGKPVGWRQMLNVADGHRGGLQKKPVDPAISLSHTISDGAPS